MGDSVLDSEAARSYARETLKKCTAGERKLLSVCCKYAVFIYFFSTS